VYLVPGGLRVEIPGGTSTTTVSWFFRRPEQDECESETMGSPGPMVLRAPGKLIVVDPLYYKKIIYYAAEHINTS
jgi:hypothetical protein